MASFWKILSIIAFTSLLGIGSAWAESSYMSRDFTLPTHNTTFETQICKVAKRPPQNCISRLNGGIFAIKVLDQGNKKFKLEIYLDGYSSEPLAELTGIRMSNPSPVPELYQADMYLFHQFHVYLVNNQKPGPNKKGYLKVISDSVQLTLTPL